MVHIKSIHEGVKFPCIQCDYKVTQKGDLMLHIKSKHEGVRFPCIQCDYKATTRSSLSSHIQSMHKGLKFSCDQCDYEAKQRTHLLTHIKSKHEGVRLPCNQCDYKASQPSSLINKLFINYFCRIVIVFKNVTFSLKKRSSHTLLSISIDRGDRRVGLPPKACLWHLVHLHYPPAKERAWTERIATGLWVWLGKQWACYSSQPPVSTASNYTLSQSQLQLTIVSQETNNYVFCSGKSHM